jgi:hypothetical protein
MNGKNKNIRKKIVKKIMGHVNAFYMYFFHLDKGKVLDTIGHDVDAYFVC